MAVNLVSPRIAPVIAILYNKRMLALISTIALGLIALGWKFRKSPALHIPCMMLAFLTDLGLVLYIEWTRHAIHTFQVEVFHPERGGLLIFHVTVSLLTLVLYIAQIVTGFALLKGNAQRRLPHRLIANLFVACRLLNYVTSFFVVNPPPV